MKNLKQRQRRAELLKAGKEYAQDNSYAWADLDGAFGSGQFDPMVRRVF